MHNNAILGQVKVFEDSGLDASFGGLSVNRTGTQLYAGVRLSDEHGFVAAIDMSTEAVPRVIGKVPLDFFPTAVSLDPVRTRLYVAQMSFSSQVGTLSVIDTATNTVTATIPVGNVPVTIAVHPAGTRVYVANAHSGTLSAIDTSTIRVVATIKIRRERPITYRD